MATTKQRRRQLAREKWERQQARRAASVRQRRLVIAVVVAIAVVAALVFALGAWWLPEDEPAAAPPDGECQYAETSPREGIGVPPADPVAATAATITLDGQPVTVELFAQDAPCTVNSLAHLAGLGYFDGTDCHRVTTSSTLRVLQCGSPTGAGDGGPGYEFGLENVDGATYPAGTVAMARRDGEPNSNGSQFFLVYDDSVLAPEYTVFGQITDGLDVIIEIADRGTVDGSEDAAPAETVTIDALVTGP